MSLKDLWHLLTKKEKIKQNYTLSSEENNEKRAIELQERKNQLELHKIQIEELKRQQAKKAFEDLKSSFEDDEYDDDDEDSDGGMIENMLGSILDKAIPQQNNPNTINVTPTQTKQPISDGDLRAFLAKQKRGYLKIAKTMPKESIIRRAKQEAQLNDEEAERAYCMLHNEF